MNWPEAFASPADRFPPTRVPLSTTIMMQRCESGMGVGRTNFMQGSKAALARACPSHSPALQRKTKSESTLYGRIRDALRRLRRAIPRVHSPAYRPWLPRQRTANRCQSWCPEEDSNLHASRRQYLKLVRLPIPPSGLEPRHLGPGWPNVNCEMRSGDPVWDQAGLPCLRGCAEARP